MVAQTYARSAVVTAGHLKQYQLLLERAILHIQRARKGDLKSRNRAQDIVAQIQSSLNLELESACQLFEVMGYTWDALEWNGPIFYDRAEDLLRQLKEVIVILQRRRN